MKPKSTVQCFTRLWVVCGVCLFCAHSVAATNTGLTAGATNASVERPLDPMEKWFTDTIAAIKGKLQNPALSNATEREILKSDLSRYERKLSEHQEKQQADRIARDAMYADSAKLRQLLAPTQDLQRLFKSQQEQYERTLADMDLNAQLWANYNQAKQTRDPEQVAKAERELADYLTAQIGRIDHKQYPKGMTLSEVMSYYEKHSGHRTALGWVSKRCVVLFVLAAVLLLPPAILLLKSRRR